MAFLTPFIPAIAGGLSSILGSKLGGGSGGLTGKSTGGLDTSGLLNEQVAGMRQTRNTASNLMPAANDLLQQSSRSFSPVISHYSGLLSGDRGRATSELAPDINRINQSYNNQLQTSSALMPRGGGRSALLSEAPYARQRDISTLMQGARGTGAQGLLQAGTAAGGQGSNLISSILSGLAGASSGGSNLLNYDLQAKAQQSQRNQQLGQQIYGILGPLLGKIPGLLGGGKDINV